jgi:translation initiation factor IF-3
VPEVLVIDADGSKLGNMPIGDALRRAQVQGLNLVEVAPNVKPPVCKILDYGKYKYDLKQDAKRKKKNQVVVELKEVKWRPKVDKHDFDFKVRHVLRFLSEGNRVKCTIMFRGREMSHTEIGEEVLNRVVAEFENKIVIDQRPKLEGRNMSMMISPKAGAFPKPKKKPLPNPGKTPVKKADNTQKAAQDEGKSESEPVETDVVTKKVETDVTAEV